MPFFERDGLRFHYQEQGRGLPVVFQHGLGADVTQPFGLFQPPEGVRLLAFDCRGHGETRPLGDPEKIGLAHSADDLIALLDHLAIDRAVVGGISMGAAIALNLALRCPDRVLGLILSRPAWLEARFPENVRFFPRIAALIQQAGAKAGQERFRQSADYEEALRLSPDVAQSYLNQFESPRAEDAAIRLDRIPKDAPCLDRSQWQSIQVPTLVLANQQDPVHPYDYAQTLAQAIRGAVLRELTPKSVSVDQHTADVQREMTGFLKQHFLQ